MIKAGAAGVGLALGDIEHLVARLVARRLLYPHGEDGAGETLYDWTPAPSHGR